MKDPVRQPEVEREFAVGLRELRRQHKLSQTDVAEKLSATGRPVGQAWVTWLESGRSRVTLADAEMIADLLGTDVASVREIGRRKRSLLAQASGRWPK